jgi:hypothetical protein
VAKPRDAGLGIPTIVAGISAAVAVADEVGQTIIVEGVGKRGLDPTLIYHSEISTTFTCSEKSA